MDVKGKRDIKQTLNTLPYKMQPRDGMKMTKIQNRAQIGELVCTNLHRKNGNLEMERKKSNSQMRDLWSFEVVTFCDCHLTGFERERVEWSQISIALLSD